jgi:hypothetical protein
MLAAVIERPGAVTVRRPPGEAAQAQALAKPAQALAGAAQALVGAAQALALAGSERSERLKIVLDVARP